MDRVLSGAALEMKTRCIEMTPFYHCKKAELPDTKGGAPIRATVGNAPTALIRAWELFQEGRLSPALVIAAPVGFVHVVESKELWRNAPCPRIIAQGRKGGSTVAAAILNALLYQAAGRNI